MKKYKDVLTLPFTDEDIVGYLTIVFKHIVDSNHFIIRPQVYSYSVWGFYEGDYLSNIFVCLGDSVVKDTIVT